MNIVALNWNDLKNPFAGGAEVQLEEVLRRLVKFGHNVTLVCSGWKGCNHEEVIHGVRILRWGTRYNFNLVVPPHLKRLVKREKFDVLLEDINKVPFYTPWYLDIDTVVAIPHLFADSIFQETNFVFASYVYLAEKPLIRAYRDCKYYVVSESTADDIIARGVPEDDVRVIYNGLDHDDYTYDPSIPKYERPTIVYLGRIKKYKSIQHLIEAFARVRKALPDARMMVIGDGDYLPALQAQARDLNLSNEIEFTGFIPQQDKIDRLRRSHVAVLPSTKEGWGLTNIEANAVGTPVIAADAPGLRDSVRHHETGFLFPWGDIDALTERLLQILTDDELAARLTRGGLEWAGRFSWDKTAREVESLLKEVVQQGR